MDMGIDRARLNATIELLRHRGPDDEGTMVDHGVGFAHTRLSLLDLNQRSAQPFWDETGRYCIVYNGEIYNFKALRTELEQRGVVFRTTSDTEVVLACFIAFGVDETVKRLEGMYAFGVWDRSLGRLTLARDPFGIKPLFFYQDNDRFLFSSEIQAFAPWLDFRPDLQSVISFLYGFGGPTNERTFFDGIEFLPPGSVVEIERGQRAVPRHFFTVDELWDQDLHDQLAAEPTKDLARVVEDRLHRSVETQLFADARVGVLCSGGIDSALLVALATRHHDDLAIFHADVVGPASERKAAEVLATHLGLDLRVVEVYDDDFIELLPKLTQHSGNPFHLTPHAVPFFKVSELVEEDGVKAVLSGEGADELFLGYPWLAPGRTRRRQSRLAASPSTVLAQSAESTKGRSLLHRRGQHGRTVPVDMITALLNGFEVEPESERNRRRVANLPDPATRLRVTESLDLLNYNLRALLHRNDAMGMAAHIESRFPFLDTDLARTAVNLPAPLKIRRGFNPRDRRHPLYVDKWVLRRIAGDYLPRELQRRPKYPFSTNAFERMRIGDGLFRRGFVAETFRLTNDEVGRLMRGSNRRLRIKLLHLEVWGRVFVLGDTPEVVVESLRNHVTFSDARI